MKSLVCEMCGSTDLIKEDGAFICKYCGCKYSIEEAKKMMIDGTVDVSGSTVRVDTSNELENLYQIARRARDENNAENAARYYDMILLKDPTSWEASFYVVYFKAMESKIAYIQSAANSVERCEENVLTLIKNYVPENQQSQAVSEIVVRCRVIATILAEAARSHYNSIDFSIRDQYIGECVNNITAASDIMYHLGSEIKTIFRNTPIEAQAAEAWKIAIEVHKIVLSCGIMFAKSIHKGKMMGYAQLIGKYDPEYLTNYESKKENKVVEESKILKKMLLVLLGTLGICLLVVIWVYCNY